MEKDSDLSDVQREILSLLLEEGLSQKEIASRRNTTHQAVSKIVEKLKIKGLLPQEKRRGCLRGGMVYNQASLSTPHSQVTTTAKWRYHALEFEINPYYLTPAYFACREKVGNHSIPMGRWKLILYQDKIMMWLEAGADFQHENRDEAVQMAVYDFNKELFRASRRFGFKVWKDGSAKIRLVNHHLAQTNSALSKAVNEDFVTIKGQDGKVWLVFDRSKGLREHEYVHSKRAVDDADRLEPYIEDLKQNQPLTNSQLTSRMGDMVTLMEKVVKTLKDLTEKD